MTLVSLLLIFLQRPGAGGVRQCHYSQARHPGHDFIDAPVDLTPRASNRQHDAPVGFADGHLLELGDWYLDFFFTNRAAEDQCWL